MRHMHMKPHKNMERISKNMIILLQFIRKIYIFSKKSYKYHKKHEEITFINMKNISILMKHYKK